LRRSPVLISAMMSASTENDPFGNSWFSKRRAVNRIDALIALAMAVGAATAQAEAHSYLETSEMVVL
jgi:phage terminase large subunit-like protein